MSTAENKPTEVSMLIFASRTSEFLGLQTYLADSTKRKVQVCDVLTECSADSKSQILAVLDLDSHSSLLTEIFQWQTQLGLSWFKMICLSSSDNEEAMLLYYALGVSDFVLKPLRPKELSGKVKRLLTDQAIFEPNLELQFEIDEVLLGNLTMRELQILKVLQSAPRSGINREELYFSVWKEVSVHRKTLDVHIFNIRRKLRPLGFDICCEAQKFRISRMSEKQSVLVQQR